MEIRQVLLVFAGTATVSYLSNFLHFPLDFDTPRHLGLPRNHCRYSVFSLRCICNV